MFLNLLLVLMLDSGWAIKQMYDLINRLMLKNTEGEDTTTYHTHTKLKIRIAHLDTCRFR